MVPLYLRRPSSSCRYPWWHRQTLWARSRWLLAVDFSVSNSRPWCRRVVL